MAMDFVKKMEAIARKAGFIVRTVKGCRASEIDKIPIRAEIPEEYLRLFKNDKKRSRGKKKGAPRRSKRSRD